MKTIEITTAQKVTIQYELASIANRFTALFIDMCIWIGFLVLFSRFFASVLAFNESFSFYYLYLFILPVVLFYTLVSEILLDGQTLGKRLVGLKVVKLNGDSADSFDYVIRWAFRFLDIWLSAGSIAAMLISSSNYNQRLGCLLSGTTVIKKKSSKVYQLNEILNIQSLDDYAPVYPQVIKLSEKDLLFLKKTIERYNKYKNEAHQKAVLQLSKKMTEILDIDKIPTSKLALSPADDKIIFLKTLLSDYIVLTR
jgi:uncharacterized RDD family membrane protein YckC